MPSSKPGRKKKPPRLLSSSPRNNDPNQPIETGQAIPADTPTSPSRPRAISELATPAEITTEEDNETTITKYVSTTPGSLKVKMVVLTAIIQSPHQDQGLLLGSPLNAQTIQDNKQPIQDNSPLFDSRLDTGIHQPLQLNKPRVQLTPESQAAKD